jgi:type VI secretion system FHA domain protein
LAKSLKLRIMSYQRLAPGMETTREVRGERITIGRASDNDWVLPDPEKKLSRHHCTIEPRGAGYFLIDTSANGVFVNHGEDPLGRGRIQLLQDATTLTLGDYEIAIEIDGGTSARKAPSPGGPEEELFPHSAESQASLDRLFNERVDAILSPPKAPRSMESERIDDLLDLPDPNTADLIPEDWDPLGDEARGDDDPIAGHRLVDEETPTNRVAEKHISSTEAPKVHLAGDQAADATAVANTALPNLLLAAICARSRPSTNIGVPLPRRKKQRERWSVITEKAQLGVGRWLRQAREMLWHREQPRRGVKPEKDQKPKYPLSSKQRSTPFRSGSRSRSSS